MRNIEIPDVEVSMPHFLPAKSRMRFPALTLSALLISGIVAYSPSASAQQGHLIPSQPSRHSPVGFKILSATDGVDWLPYLSGLAGPLGLKFHAKIPAAAAHGGKGIVAVRVRIHKDGTVPDDCVAIASSSGNEDMDAAALSATRAAAPFARLPEGYRGTYLDLQLRFYYHRRPPEPEPEPKIVPLKTPENV
jgi:TonB family protein